MNAMNTPTDQGRIWVVIPARMASQRLPGKPLVSINGEPLISRTVRLAEQVAPLEFVIVAGCDEEVRDWCVAAGVRYQPTDPAAPNGTVRCYQAMMPMRGLQPHDHIINLQVDEPFVSPSLIRMLLGREVSTPLCPLSDDAQSDFNVVKCAASNSRCHWFTRQPVPDGYHHIGVYHYPWSVLPRLSRLPCGVYARSESLEQLTWLESGYLIRPVFSSSAAPFSINSAADVEAVTALMTH